MLRAIHFTVQRISSIRSEAAAQHRKTAVFLVSCAVISDIAKNDYIDPYTAKNLYSRYYAIKYNIYIF